MYQLVINQYQQLNNLLCPCSPTHFLLLNALCHAIWPSLLKQLPRFFRCRKQWQQQRLKSPWVQSGNRLQMKLLTLSQSHDGLIKKNHDWQCSKSEYNHVATYKFQYIFWEDITSSPHQKGRQELVQVYCQVLSHFTQPSQCRFILCNQNTIL